MKHLKKFKEVNEASVPLTSKDGEGEYPTEVMDAFMRELIETMEWSGDDVERWKKVNISIPSAGMRNASSSATSKEEALEYWEAAVSSYGDEENAAWFVWHAIVGGSFNKPKQFSTQRFDIESIIEIVRKYPDSVKRINVSWNSVNQEDFAKMMRRDYYTGKPGNWTGD